MKHLKVVRPEQTVRRTSNDVENRESFESYNDNELLTFVGQEIVRHVFCLFIHFWFRFFILTACWLF